MSLGQLIYQDPKNNLRVKFHNQAFLRQLTSPLSREELEMIFHDIDIDGLTDISLKALKENIKLPIQKTIQVNYYFDPIEASVVFVFIVGVQHDSEIMEATLPVYIHYHGMLDRLSGHYDQITRYTYEQLTELMWDPELIHSQAPIIGGNLFDEFFTSNEPPPSLNLVYNGHQMHQLHGFQYTMGTTSFGPISGAFPTDISLLSCQVSEQRYQQLMSSVPSYIRSLNPLMVRLKHILPDLKPLYFSLNEDDGLTPNPIKLMEFCPFYIKYQSQLVETTYFYSIQAVGGESNIH